MESYRRDMVNIESHAGSTFPVVVRLPQAGSRAPACCIIHLLLWCQHGGKAGSQRKDLGHHEGFAVPVRTLMYRVLATFSEFALRT